MVDGLVVPSDLACWVPGKAWSQTTGLISCLSNNTALGLTQIRFILARCLGNMSCSPDTGSDRTSALLGENTSPKPEGFSYASPCQVRGSYGMAGWNLHILSPCGSILLPRRGT